MKENIPFEKYKAREKQLKKPNFSGEMYRPKLDVFDFNYENKYKQFLCETFFLSKEVFSHPIAGYIIGFGPENIKTIADEVKLVLSELKRKHLFIEAGGKTFIQCVRCHTGKDCVTYSDAFSILDDILLDTESVIVFSEFSKCKIRGDKASLVRSIIKRMENKKSAASNLIFIDYARFYQESINLLGPYLRYMG